VQQWMLGRRYVRRRSRFAREQTLVRPRSISPNHPGNGGKAWIFLDEILVQ
jgi:hypothetical protein